MKTYSEKELRGSGLPKLESEEKYFAAIYKDEIKSKVEKTKEGVLQFELNSTVTPERIEAINKEVDKYFGGIGLVVGCAFIDANKKRIIEMKLNDKSPTGRQQALKFKHSEWLSNQG